MLEARPLSAVRATVMVAFLTSFVACGNDPTEPEPTSVERYELIMFEGVPVPGVLVQIGDLVLGVVSGEFLINADGSCTGGWVIRVIDGDQTSDTSHSWDYTWTEAGDTISFTQEGHPMGVASLVEGQLTVTHFTGAVCIAAPCPTHYTAIYQWVSET